jgi:2-oxoglutarate dehydrogenase E2 component (dihydrolipoamide succinyltransferase)
MSAPETVTVVMPRMGESVAEGAVLEWYKNVGDSIAADESLVAISSDKVETEIPSPCAGVVLELLAEPGAMVAAGAVIARIAATSAAPLAGDADGAPPAPAPERPQTVDLRSFVSPVAGRIAAAHGIDVGALAGSGRDGRVTRRDVEAAIARPAAPPPRSAGDDVHVEPMTRIRLSIAEHMRRSLDTAAHVTTTFEVDLTKVVRLRDRAREDYRSRLGVRLTYLAFIAKATVDVLHDWPLLNSELRGEEIHVKRSVHLGLAVAREDPAAGLVVPVIRHAETLGLEDLARAAEDVARRTREGGLRPAELTGGTFTITNPGVWGGLLGTPIINQPQVAILAVLGIHKRPLVVTGADGEDQVAIRHVANFCLSYDHRLIDGAYGHQFLRRLKHELQRRELGDYAPPTH